MVAGKSEPSESMALGWKPPPNYGDLGGLKISSGSHAWALIGQPQMEMCQSSVERESGSGRTVLGWHTGVLIVGSVYHSVLHRPC